MGAAEGVGEAVEQIGDETGDGGVELSGEETGSVVLLLGDGYGDVFAFPAHDAASPQTVRTVSRCPLTSLCAGRGK